MSQGITPAPLHYASVLITIPLPMPDERPISIVDDCDDDVFFATRLLRKGGFSAPILTCGTGRELVATLRNLLNGPRVRLPRLILLDIKMPEMGGFDTLKWIRSEDGLADVAVVMLSGSNEVRDRELASALGADGYLVKYPTHQALACLVREAIAASASRARR